VDTVRRKLFQNCVRSEDRGVHPKGPDVVTTIDPSATTTTTINNDNNNDDDNDNSNEAD
jgi:hypothetical protein